MTRISTRRRYKKIVIRRKWRKYRKLKKKKTEAPNRMIKKEKLKMVLLKILTYFTFKILPSFFRMLVIFLLLSIFQFVFVSIFVSESGIGAHDGRMLIDVGQIAAARIALLVQWPTRNVRFGNVGQRLVATQASSNGAR